MKATELRIGNLVIVTNTGGYNNIGDIISIDSISKNGVNSWSDMGASGCNPFCEIEPIPLTEEWLLKLGFNKVHESKTWEEVKISDIDGEYMYWISGMYYLTQNGNWWSLYHSTDEDTYWQIHHNVQYIHQLQNLYFALTNTELEIK